VLVAFDATDPLLDGNLRSSLCSRNSGICSDSLVTVLLNGKGRRAGDRGPIGLGGMAEKVVKPLTEVLLVCVARKENVGWKSCWVPRMKDGRVGDDRAPAPKPVKRGGVDD